MRAADSQPCWRCRRFPPVPVMMLQFLTLTIDASDVPADYILAIFSQCSTFPEASAWAWLHGQQNEEEASL